MLPAPYCCPRWLYACNRPAARKSVGLQLYTLRDVIFKDLKGTLQKVAAFGYTEVETFSYSDGKIFGQPFASFVAITRDLGLKITSGHYLTGFNQNTSGTLRNGWEQAVADAKLAGQEYMVIAFLFEGERQKLDDYKRLCEELNRAGEVCRTHGIKLGYHNHAFEFETLEGQVPYDVMLAELDPELVCMEMDLYWVVRAGKKPADYFKKYPGRFELWHVKDMHKEDENRNADLGQGRINFPEIFGLAKQAGMKRFYVEQETYEVSSLASAENNYKYIAGIL
ncbi:MAG: sugar phosphate isomerase [Cyclobacteriaceae bacterium]|nr:MAG: sugar phosphate isomerase [Cyclobacteriaceae bacterium]